MGFVNESKCGANICLPLGSLSRLAVTLPTHLWILLRGHSRPALINHTAFKTTLCLQCWLALYMLKFILAV